MKITITFDVESGRWRKIDQDKGLAVTRKFVNSAAGMQREDKESGQAGGFRGWGRCRGRAIHLMGDVGFVNESGATSDS